MAPSATESASCPATASTGTSSETRMSPNAVRVTPRPTTWTALSFYAHLQNNCPHLLKFRCHGDKWQTVKGWLLRRGLVTDRL